MKKFLIFLSFVVVICLFILFAGNALLHRSFERRLDTLPPILSEFGLKFSQFSLDKFSISSYRKLHARDIRSEFFILDRKLYDPEESYFLRIGELALSSLDHNYTDLTLNAYNVQIVNKRKMWDSSPSKLAKNIIHSSDNLTIEEFGTSFGSEPSKPEIASKKLLSELSTILNTGKTKVEFKLTAFTKFQLGEENVQVPIVILKDSQGFSLALDKEEFKTVANYFDPPLNDSLVETLSNNPLRAPTIVDLRTIAKAKANDLAENVPELRKEVFEDVYWAFLLYQKFRDGADLILEKSLLGLSSKKAEQKKYLYSFALNHISEERTEKELEWEAAKQKGKFPRRSGAVLLR